jgi:hypothetical protein
MRALAVFWGVILVALAIITFVFALNTVDNLLDSHRMGQIAFRYWLIGMVFSGIGRVLINWGIDE